MRKKNKLRRYEYQDAFEKRYDQGWEIRRIAGYLGRNPSTISRLFRRDIHPSPSIWRRMTSYEKAMYAWEKSRKRASQSRKRLRLKNERIRKIVVFLLRRWHWSPENISDFLEEYGVLISAKAIYNFIKKERPALIEYLRRRGKPRRQRVARRRSYFKDGVPEKKSIHSRPPIIQCGHWEIDTIHSRKGSKAAVLTLRELRTRNRFYFLLPDLEAKSVTHVLLPFFQRLPKHLCLTLTSDNGSEFSELYKLERVIEGFRVYYCDPYKAYQRGSVENANGELRWYFPKGTDFAEVSQRELKAAQYKINSKPMRVNNKRSSAALYQQLLQCA